MSAEPVKLPLAVKKAIRDLEPKQVAALATTSKLAGFPADVKFEYNVEAAYAAMDGHKDQDKLPNVVIEKYLPAAIEALNRAWKEDLVSAAFLKAFTAKHITFTIVPADFVVDKASPAIWNGYNGLRMEEGRLDIFIKKSTFWTNTDKLWQIKLAEVLDPIPTGGLPLSVQVKIRETKADRDTQLARAAKALGLDALTCDVDADYAQILATAEKPNVDAYTQYLKAIATCFEKKAADDMVKEAVVDAMKEKKISVRVVPDMKAVSGLKMDNGYNGVQFDGGVVTVLTTPKNYWTNVSKAEQFDLVKLF